MLFLIVLFEPFTCCVYFLKMLLNFAGGPAPCLKRFSVHAMRYCAIQLACNNDVLAIVSDARLMVFHAANCLCTEPLHLRVSDMQYECGNRSLGIRDTPQRSHNNVACPHLQVLRGGAGRAGGASAEQPVLCHRGVRVGAARLLHELCLPLVPLHHDRYDLQVSLPVSIFSMYWWRCSLENNSVCT